MIDGINHIGIVTGNIEETLTKWKTYMELEVVGSANYPERGQMSTMVKIGESSYIELMQPLGESGVIADFLKKHGEGIHHISLHTNGLSGDCNLLGENGIKVLGNPGDAVRFTHPKTTNGVLFEVTESRNEKVEY